MIDPSSSQAQTSDPLYPHGFGLCINVLSTIETSIMQTPNLYLKNNPLFIPIVSTIIGPQPTIQKPINETSHDQSNPPKLNFKPPNSCYLTH